MRYAPPFESISWLTGKQFARDALPLHTWLAVGALLAALVAHLVSARVALLVPSAYLIATTADTLLVVLGLKANPRMARVARTKFASSRTLLPPAGAYGDDDDDGSQAGAKRGSGVVVLLIGATSHHPLGILAPGFGAVGDYMVRMQRELDARRDEYGLLASSAWLSAEQVSGNGNLAVMYFRDYAFVSPPPFFLENGSLWWQKTMTDGQQGPAQVRPLGPAPRGLAAVEQARGHARPPAHLARAVRRAAGPLGEHPRQRAAQHAHRRDGAPAVPGGWRRRRGRGPVGERGGGRDEGRDELQQGPHGDD